MTPKQLEKLAPGTKLVYTYTNKAGMPISEVLDWGYMGQTGKAIVYEEDCCNMQDARAVNPKKLSLLKR